MMAASQDRGPLGNGGDMVAGLPSGSPPSATEISPDTDYLRIFTIIYIFIGLGVLVLFLSAIAQQYMRQKAGTPAVRESIWAP